MSKHEQLTPTELLLYFCAHYFDTESPNQHCVEKGIVFVNFTGTQLFHR